MDNRPSTFTDYVSRVVAAAPALSPAQADLVAAAMGGAR